MSRVVTLCVSWVGGRTYSALEPGERLGVLAREPRPPYATGEVMAW